MNRFLLGLFALFVFCSLATSTPQHGDHPGHRPHKAALEAVKLEQLQSSLDKLWISVSRLERSLDHKPRHRAASPERESVSERDF